MDPATTLPLETDDPDFINVQIPVAELSTSNDYELSPDGGSIARCPEGFHP